MNSNIEYNENSALSKFFEVLRIEQKCTSIASLLKEISIPAEDYISWAESDISLPTQWESAILKRYPCYTKEMLFLRMSLCCPSSPSLENKDISSPGGDVLRTIMKEAKLSFADIAHHTAVSIPFLICFALGTIPDDKQFMSIVQRVFPETSCSDNAVRRSKPPQLVYQRVSLVRRTFKQRVALWNLSSSLHLCSEKEVSAICDIINGLPRQKTIDSSKLPSALLMRHLCSSQDKRDTAFSIDLGISESTLNKFKNGQKPFDAELLSSLGRLYNYNYVWHFAVFAAELSRPSMVVPVLSSVSPEAHFKCLKEFVQALPYLDDESAERVLELLWSVRRAPSHRQEVKGMARANWGVLRDNAVSQFISSLIPRRNDDLQDFFGKLKSCSARTMNRILSGAIDMKYNTFIEISRLYGLDELQMEMFRFCCDETRRMVVFDNVGCTTQQRTAISALSNAIFYLSSDDAEAIRLICERARHRQ